MTAAKAFGVRTGLRDVLARPNISALNLRQEQIGWSAVQAGAGEECFSSVSGKNVLAVLSRPTQYQRLSKSPSWKGTRPKNRGEEKNLPQ